MLINRPLSIRADPKTVNEDSEAKKVGKIPCCNLIKKRSNNSLFIDLLWSSQVPRPTSLVVRGTLLTLIKKFLRHLFLTINVFLLAGCSKQPESGHKQNRRGVWIIRCSSFVPFNFLFFVFVLSTLCTFHPSYQLDLSNCVLGNIFHCNSMWQ